MTTFQVCGEGFEWKFDGSRSFLGVMNRLFLLLTALFTPITLVAAEAPPNIIYVMLDDAGYGDFGAFGSAHVKTPTFDQLCAEGMKFTQHYSGSAVCAPTRCVLMTGLHTGHGRRRDNTAKAMTEELSAKNGRPLVFLEEGDATVARSLKAAGYATGGIGKWGLGNPGSDGVPEKQGFDSWFGYLDQVHAHDHFPKEIWDNGQMVPLPGNAGGAKGEYVPYLQEQRTLDFIREHQDGPFFLYLAYTPPHGAYVIPTDDPAYAMYEGIPGGNKIRHYAAMITMADRAVGKMMALLKELKIDDNTIVFYTSDNGPNPEFVKAIDSAGGLRGIKRYLYEGGIRAAMAVRWPGKIPSGATSDFIWDMRDVFPTLCELGGASAPEGLDGMSVVPTLMGGQQDGRAMHYWEIHSPFQQAVRMGDWKGYRLGTKEPLELYHLGDDAAETADVSAAHPDVVKKLEAFLATARTDSPYFPAVEKVTKKGKKGKK